MIVVNMFVTAFLAFVAIQLGWLIVPTETNIYVACLVFGVVFNVATALAVIAFGILIVITCGIGCILLPFYFFIGIVGFWAFVQLFPGLLLFNATTAQILVMAVAMTLIRIPPVSVTTTTTSS